MFYGLMHHKTSYTVYSALLRVYTFLPYFPVSKHYVRAVKALLLIIMKAKLSKLSLTKDNTTVLHSN